jgi:hypothetical protein
MYYLFIYLQTAIGDKEAMVVAIEDDGSLELKLYSPFFLPFPFVTAILFLYSFIFL